MAATLTYVIEDLRLSRRNAILGEFRTSTRTLRLFDQGRRELAFRALIDQVLPKPAQRAEDPYPIKSLALTGLAVAHRRSPGMTFTPRF